MERVPRGLESKGGARVDEVKVDVTGLRVGREDVQLIDISLGNGYSVDLVVTDDFSHVEIASRLRRAADLVEGTNARIQSGWMSDFLGVYQNG